MRKYGVPIKGIQTRFKLKHGQVKKILKHEANAGEPKERKRREKYQGFTPAIRKFLKNNVGETKSVLTAPELRRQLIEKYRF